MAQRLRPRVPESRSSRTLLALLLATAYAAVAVAGEPWTLHSRVFTAIAGLAVFAYASRVGWHRTHRHPPTAPIEPLAVLGMMIWTLLITVLTVWVLAIFFSHPRSVYPTLSHMMNIVFEDYAVRVGGFLAWLAMGWYLVRR